MTETARTPKKPEKKASQKPCAEVNPEELAKLEWTPHPPGKLTVKQRSYLKGLAHHLKPVALIGQEGVTDTVLGEIRRQLLCHELIKVKWSSLSKEEGKKSEQAQELARLVGAHYVHLIGQTVIFYREPEEKYLTAKQQKRIHLPA